MKLTIVQILCALQGVNAGWSWIECDDCAMPWDSNMHCYLKGVTSNTASGTIPAVRSMGQYDNPSLVDNFVCDSSNNVYEQIYMNTTTSGFSVANVPTGTLSSVCWEQTSNKHAAIIDQDDAGNEFTTILGSVFGSTTTTLVACQNRCLSLSACVAIHYTSDTTDKCYIHTDITNIGTNNQQTNANANIYKRLLCSNSAVLAPGANSYSSYL